MCVFVCHTLIPVEKIWMMIMLNNDVSYNYWQGSCNDGNTISLRDGCTHSLCKVSDRNTHRHKVT